MAEEWDAGTIAFAHRMFDLARSGATGEPAGYAAAGLPANPTNDTGDTLLILAAYHDHPDTVAVLPAHGAEPAEGSPSAQETAAFFGLPEMTELLRAG